jgi:hypothetical protein
MYVLLHSAVRSHHYLSVLRTSHAYLSGYHIFDASDERRFRRSMGRVDRSRDWRRDGEHETRSLLGNHFAVQCLNPDQFPRVLHSSPQVLLHDLILLIFDPDFDLFIPNSRGCLIDCDYSRE